MKYFWKKDRAGDFRYESKEEYVGMVCPHKEYVQVIVDGDLIEICSTIKQAKKHLEKFNRIERKLDKQRDKLWK